MIASPRFLPAIVYTFHLKGNADPDGPDADVKTNANSMTANANAYTHRGANHSGRTRGGLIMNCRGGRAGATVFGITALSHCRAAKSNAQANDDKCCKKLLHKSASCIGRAG